MYTIHVDGQLLFSTANQDDEHIILNPMLSLDVSGSGSLSFVLPPSHALYKDGIRKMKSIITVHEDDLLLFRGRVISSERDFYNQKNVYCEGDLSFLLDSLYEEQIFSGKVLEFFRMLIDNHNKQVDEEKRFTVGTVTAVEADQPFEGEQRMETRKHWDTSTMIDEKLMGMYGGYLRTRTEGDIHYIDWLKEFEEESQQSIAFSVNLLDLKDKVDAGDVFTILIPLGFSEMGDDGTYTDPVNIKSVNNGLEYIQDDDAVDLYGKIWRTKTWGSTKSPALLLEKAREYLKTGAELQTLTLTAVDMHFVDGNVNLLRIGTKVRIVSDPHGIDMQKVCCKMDIDLLNPEKTTYTFGERPRTLTEGVIRNERETNVLAGSAGGGSGGRTTQEEMNEILRWARVTVNEATAQISMNAGEIDKTQQYMSAAGIDIDGELASVKIMASKESVDALTGRVGKAESSIKVNAGNIEMKVSKNGVISAINQSAESITISASKINLEGYVHADNLASQIAALDYITAAAMKVTSIDMGNAVIGTLTVDGKKASWKEKEVLIDVVRTKRYAMAPSGTTSMEFYEVTEEKKETIYYLGRDE